jgi:thiamine-monophosphate kinase
VLTLAVTVVGHAARAEDFVTRAGARPGEVLVVTGELGGAAAGLVLLEEPRPAIPAAAGTEALRRRQLDPTPRLDAGRALAAAGASAMIDISDGVAGDAGHVAVASGALLVIDAAALPIAPGVEAVARAAGREALELAISGGEDYELLAALPAAAVDPAREALAEIGVPLTVIGKVEAAAGAAGRAEVRLPGGGAATSRGFDQLRPRRPR